MDYGTQFDAHAVAFVEDLIRWSGELADLIRYGAQDEDAAHDGSTCTYPAWLDGAA